MSADAIQAQGTHFYISTGTGGAITVTAISKAFCAEVTGAHALSVGDRVTFASVGGMTEINTLVGTVLAVTTTTAFVVDIDSRAFTTYTSGGTATPVAYTEILGITGYNPSGASVPEIPTTDLQSTAAEFKAGLLDNGSASMEIQYLPADAGQIAARAAFAASETRSFRLTDPEATTYTFDGYISNFPTVPTATINGILSGTMSIRVSGDVTVA
jgi:hypothetical protein